MIALMLVSAAGIYFLYVLFLRRNFGDLVVNFLYKNLGMDFQEAMNLYVRLFRDNKEELFAIAVLILFFVIFRAYLSWFTGYFQEINQGMDSLIREQAEEISLSSQLFPIERKMNAIKHTIERQKADILSAEQRKNDLVMYLAHDLKTPLASVIGYLNLLQDEKHLSDEARAHYISIALGKAERLEDLINEFFEITRFNLSQIELQYSRISLTRLLEQLVFEFQPMLQEKNLRCELHAPADIMLHCDADKMQRVLDNILRNAVLYSFPDTEISLCAMQENDECIISCRNHGESIPQEKLERIFEQFYRLDASRSTSGGAGLGLAIAKQIVELHGGTINARSDQDQIVFTIVLPVS